MKRLVIVGCGFLADIVADALLAGLLPDYDLVGVYSRSKNKAERLAGKMKKNGRECKPCSSLTELLALKPDFLVNGIHKARALYHAVEGPVTQMWTISALQLHEKGIIVCDYDACSELQVKTYKYFLDIEHDNLDPDSLFK